MKSKLILSASSQKRSVPVPAWLAAFLATLLALPVNANISLPTEPLTTNSRIPPNILFILDDSGSMTDSTMASGNLTSITGGGLTSNAFLNQTYVGNTLAYNPNVTYNPWTTASGGQLTGGTSYSSAYSDNDLASGTTIDLSNAVRTFYVPKIGVSGAGLTDATNYYRYQIQTDGTIVRSERLQWAVTTNQSLSLTGLAATRNNYTSSTPYSIVVPAGASNVTITITGSNGNADLYVRRDNSTVDVNNYDWRQRNAGSNESQSISNPVAGTYYIRVHARDANGGAFTGLSLTAAYSVSNLGESGMGCDTTTSGWGWRNCVLTTHTGRSEANERTNYATWYSYYRTRMKAAKAGAGQAFGDLGNDVRVGFRTIWQRNQVSGAANRITHTNPIPVNYNYGIFADPNGVAGNYNNRTEWYRRLYDVRGSGTTPLHGALRNAGEYFSSDSSTGAYGPESGADQYSCRQNFTILTTDGYWNDFSNYPSAVGQQDGVAGSAITGPANPTYTYSPSAPYSDGHVNTLADVAMRYWKNDLRPGDPASGGLINNVPTSSANPAFWQHMVTFGISIGLQGTVDPNVPSNFAGWPNPMDAEDAHRIDDLLHASINGRGSFLSAGNPAEFASGLRAALATITERTGSFSNVAANSARLDTDTRVFQANYVSGVWTGELTAYPVTYSGTPSRPSVSATASWRASQGIPASGREIFTYDGSAGRSFPTAAQVTALERTTAPAVSGADNAAYIMGDTSRELRNVADGVPGLRNRNHLLGDIVASSPAYSKDTDTVFVGANDGMLHAFDAADGAELFAYIPRGISLSDLSSLSRPDYSHRYFVDGPTVISTRAQTPGQNILVGALGKGGKGIYALDVSDPESFDASDVKWENTNSANMGLVQSKPIIAKLNNNVTAVIVSNGINSTNGRAVLFVYNLNTGVLLAEIDTGVGSGVANDPLSNGLSAPVGWDADGNGTTDYVYAGDMLGNVWKFNLTSSNSNSWTNASNRTRLFTASYPSTPAQVQPITGAVTVALDPVTYNPWVFFGTGRFMTAGDVSSSNVQSVYGVIDDGTGTTVTRAQLQERKIVVTGTGSDGSPVRGFEEASPLTTTAKGWRIDLLTPASTPVAEGERVVSDAQVIADVLVFSSIIPEADACQPDGRGYLNALNAFTGASLEYSFFDLDRDGDFKDETLVSGGKTLPVGSIDTGVGMPTLANLLRGMAVVGGSSGGNNSKLTDDKRNVGRVSWREVLRD